MTLFRFGHAQKNSFAFFVALLFRKIAVGLGGLDFRLPVAPCSIDRLLMIVLLAGHAPLKRKERRFPIGVSSGERTRPRVLIFGATPKIFLKCNRCSLLEIPGHWRGRANRSTRGRVRSPESRRSLFNQQAPSQRSRTARHALVAAVP